MLRFGPFESKASCHNYSLIQGRCEVSEVFVRLFFEQKVNESDSPWPMGIPHPHGPWGHLQQQKYQASWKTESVVSPMNKTVGSVVNSDSHLDAPLTRLNVQEEVWFENLVLSKEFVLNPVVFDIGQLYLIGTTNHTNQMHLICISPISRVCVYTWTFCFINSLGFFEYVTYDTSQVCLLDNLRVTIIGTHHLQHRFMVVCFCIRTDNIKCHNFPSGCNPYHLIFLN